MAVTVSELFREYEADFKASQEQIDALLQKASDEPSSSSSSSLAKAQELARQAEQALKQLDMEAKTMPAGERSTLEPTLRRYRSDLGAKRTRIAELKEAGERESLLSGGGTVLGKSLQERDRAEQANRKMQQAQIQLELARNQALEAEQVAAEVGSDLRSQRETIIRARGNVREIGMNYGYAKQVIESMQRRAEANKMMTKAVACFMCTVLAIALYFMIGGGFSGGQGPPTPIAPTAEGGAPPGAR